MSKLIHYSGPAGSYILPSGYTRLAYIQSTGSQWVDTRTTLSDKGSTLYIEYEETEIRANTTITGSQLNNNPYILRQTLYRPSSSDNLSLYNSTQNSIKTIIIPRGRIHSYSVINNSNQLTWNINGSTYTYTYTNGNAQTNTQYIFANHIETGAAQQISAKLYMYRLWNQNGQMIRNYVPVQTTSTVISADGTSCSSGSIGLLDLVENKFYQNKGTGIFIAGPECPQGFPTSEYCQVEWLEGTGTQYIDTNIKNNNDYTYEVYGNYTSTIQSNFAGLIGAADANDSNRMSIRYANGYMQGVFYGTSYGTKSLDTARHLFKLNKTSYILDSTTTSINNTTTFTSTTTVNIFRENNSGNQNQRYSKARIEYVKIYNNTTLIHHYIPCYRRSDMKPGMYDIVSRTFLTNSGTGEFLLGPSITFGYGMVMNDVGGTYNLFKSFNVGGRVTLVGTNGFDCIFNDEDHYAFLNMHPCLDGHLYTFFCDVSGLPSNGYIHFNLWNSETYYPWKLFNGHNSKTFLINSSKIPNYGANNYTQLNRMLFDDGSRSTTNGATISIRNMHIVYGPVEDDLSAIPHNISSGEGRMGEKNGSFQFNGIDSYISLLNPGFESFFNNRTWTIGFWMNPTSLPANSNPANWKRLFVYRTKTTSDTSTKQCVIYLTKTGLGISFYADDTEIVIPGLETNKWIHVAYTINGNISTLYVNGVKVGTASKGTCAIPIGSRLDIGMDPGRGMGAFDGKIEGFQLYNECLEATAIPSLM